MKNINEGLGWRVEEKAKEILVAFDTGNSAGQRLIDDRLLNVVLVLMLTTSIFGPVLTEYFAPRLLKDTMPPRPTSTSSHMYLAIRQLPM
jgi:hypothetical protein